MSENNHFDVTTAAARVKDAARALARCDRGAKDDALFKMADALRERTDALLAANALDLERARERELEPAFVDRLALDAARVEKMAGALEEVAALPDPIGRLERSERRPNGLVVARQRIPLGVIGIIYESRPNVTSDAAALCLKSGNGVLLKGGSDAYRSNRAVHQALTLGLERSALPPAARGAIGFVDTTDRDAVRVMLGLSDHLDVIIPRGGKRLIRFVHEHARVPVIKHDEGVCHVVVDASARPELVDAILVNAKAQRPGVCNAAETILFTAAAAAAHLPRALAALVGAGVTLHCGPRALALARAAGLPEASLREGGDEAFAAEFLSLDVAVGVVDDLSAAIAHIDRYSSRHTEAILTEDYSASRRFLREVDSSTVVVNASTRFADGGQLGLGAEIGISTTRLHAYGPMGLEELTTTKFVVTGDGQIRS
jgi:glutamate-5-semialdehyde dehydrogenase